jgi:hypothetical protein
MPRRPAWQQSRRRSAALALPAASAAEPLHCTCPLPPAVAAVVALLAAAAAAVAQVPAAAAAAGLLVSPAAEWKCDCQLPVDLMFSHQRQG